ncbi:hypothetical protein ACWCXE_00035 [Streptomyces sp. NPDC001780]
MGFDLPATLPGTATTPGPAAAPRSGTVEVPPEVTAGVAVFDRRTGAFTEQLNPHLRFRSASVVKLLIALDHAWERGPRYTLTPADRARFDVMLRASDDAAASRYWSANGGPAIVDRMVSRLGLVDTAGPPAGYPDYWGYTALSAADTVRIYRWILDSAPAAVRDLVMGNLRRSTRCGTDGFDQRFGIPASFELPWAVKQGWSGFGPSGDRTNTSPAATAPQSQSTLTPTPDRADGTAPTVDVDLTQRALHTTGTVGTGDRSIVAVFTLQPRSTAFGAAYTDLSRLVRSLNVPGGTLPAGTWFGTWGSEVRVRADTTTGSTTLTRLPAGVEVLVACQKRGQRVDVPPYSNDWWAYLPLYGGYVTNIYMRSPDNQLPNVPTC